MKLVASPPRPARGSRRACAAFAVGCAALAPLLLARAGEAQAPRAVRAESYAPRGASPVAPAGAEWTHPAGDYANTRFSTLRQITPANVGSLREVWQFSPGIEDGYEGQPLVIGHRLYMATPFPNRVYAFDLTGPTPVQRWEYAPHEDSAAYGKACCDRVNRGLAYDAGTLFYNRLDNVTVALDAESGRVRWEKRLGEVEQGETRTMAPIVVDGKVIVGNSGGDLGVRGWLAALDEHTGDVVWRAYSTGSDKDALIGDSFQPFYSFMRGHDLGLSSWPSDQWKMGGGAAWGWISYDPELRLLYYGGSNPGVWNPDMRPGLNLWSSTLWARDPATGQARWAYQFTPHDMWDYDAVNESILADLVVDGRPRRALVHFDRNGFAYTIDRTTGEVLVAKPYVTVNWATGIDLRTGLPRLVPAKETHQGRMTRDICPSSTGGKDEQPSAYSPATGLFYVPTHNLCMDYGALEAEYIAGTPYLGAAVKMYAGPGGNQGELIAWDAAAGRRVWGIKERFPVWSGVLATAGGVVFYGTLDGDFKAVDARSGRALWTHHFDSGIVGNPITFTGADGKQYVAVYSGVGGWYGAMVPAKWSKDDPYAALGVVGAAAPLQGATKKGGALHLFALP